MSSDKRKTQSGGQGVLGFEIDPTGEVDDVTARSGLPLVVETMRALGVDEAVTERVHVRRRRSGFTEVEMVEAFVLLLASGGECLDDFSVLGGDRGLLRLLGKEKLPSPDAARQFLRSFHDEALMDAARESLLPDEKSLIVADSAPLLGLGRVNQHLIHRVQAARPGKVATVEHDNTIIESSKRAAQPHYKGGRGYQPGVAYWVEQDLVLADEFRDGNVPAGKRPLDLIRRAFAVLPASVERRRFRADSAAYEESTLKWLSDPENRIERFTVSADMGSELQRLCAAVPDAGWKLYEERTTETVHWAEVVFCPGTWPKGAKPLRTLVRKVQKRQGELFANGSDRMHFAIVSNDFDMDGAKLIAWHYQKAGHIEGVHDVLKNELGAGVLPCADFGANAAWFRLCVLTYNVLSAMKTLALDPEFADARPKRLRFALFTIPARILSHARRLFARVAKVVAEKVRLVTARGRLRHLMAPPCAVATAA